MSLGISWILLDLLDLLIAANGRTLAGLAIRA